MKRAALLAVLVLAGCGGTHTTEPANTGSRNVTKPLNRAIGVDLGNGSSVSLRRASSKTTKVTLEGKTGGASLELDTGSCGAKAGLQTIEKLSGNGPWTVNESLTALTASPLAVVLRKGGKVVACGQVRSA